MIKIRKESIEVLYLDEEVVAVDRSDLDELKRLALLNPRQRVRLCTHRSPDDPLHEMFIVHTRDCYVRPHKHLGKSESMTVLEGIVDVVLFDDDGAIRDVVRMGAPGTGRVFYQRLSDPIYHTLIIRSEFLVFQETTGGPFLRENTVFPEWAPVEQGTAPAEFMDKIKLLISERGGRA
jgi:cupin fold WbuC family metalloprotein